MKNCWVFGLVLFASTVLFSTRAALAHEATWVEVRSPHFSVITDAGERRGREVATRFEQMRAVFTHLIIQAKVNTPIPLEIVAFRNAKELREVSPLWKGKPVELAGLFQPGTDRCFIMLDMAADNPWTTVFHEYAHQLMNGTVSAPMDPWFEEGFAEYFSSIEVDSHQARVGKIPPMTYDIIRQNGMMKIADLFRIRHSSSTYNENGNRRTVFYAESSMVVHYLYDNDLIPKLAKYFDLKYKQDLSGEDAIQQSFGMSAANFDKAIQSYVASNQYKYYVMKTPADIETTGYTSRPISATDAAAVIADIHAHSPDYQEKAMAEFEEILQSDPNNAAACRGLGYAYLQKRTFDKAEEYFQRAAEADSRDPRVHYYSGLLMNMKGSVGQSDLKFVTEELKKAIALDPDFADAYMQLAFAQQRDGDIAGAMVSAKKAISLNPRNQGYYFNLANLYMQQRQIPEALSILQALTKSSDQAIAMRASAAASQIQTMEAEMKGMEISRSSPESAPPSLAKQSPRAREETPPPVHVSSGAAAPSVGNLSFLKGTIAKVDCSSPPAATLTVTSGGRTWTMQVRDSHHVLVLGGDAFSCAWSKQKVALNYLGTGVATGSVISIEIQ